MWPKNKKIKLSYLRNDLTDRHEIGPLDRSDHYSFEISKIQDGGGRHLEKSKNCRILAST